MEGVTFFGSEGKPKGIPPFSSSLVKGNPISGLDHLSGKQQVWWTHVQMLRNHLPRWTSILKPESLRVALQFVRICSFIYFAYKGFLLHLWMASSPSWVPFFTPFWGRVPFLKDYRKKEYPYSNWRT